MTPFDKAARAAAKEIDSMWEAHSDNRVRPVPDTASIMTHHLRPVIAEIERLEGDNSLLRDRELLLHNRTIDLNRECDRLADDVVRLKAKLAKRDEVKP